MAKDDTVTGERGGDPDKTLRRRFLTLEDVAEELATSRAQVYALVRRGELRSIRLGGRGQWRVGRDDLEAYIADLYAETERFIAANVFVESKHPNARGNDPAEDF